MSKEDHPAMIAARNSWRCVQAKDKEGWLDLMAEDVLFEDPIGVAITNPTGEGVHGKAELGEFWEKNMANSTIRIETHESRVAGMESAHLMTLTTTLSNGVISTVRGFFTYRVNDAGRLSSLRGYWTMDDMSFEQPSGGS
jgi:steroid delta-isomerase